MVGTRGKRSARGALTTGTIRHVDNATDNQHVEIRPRKRQRSNGTQQAGDRGPPASKSQVIAVASSPSEPRGGDTSSPRNTRHHPAVIPDEGHSNLQGGSNVPEQLSIVSTAAPHSPMPNLAPVPLEEAASNALSEYTNQNTSLMAYASQGYEQMGVVDTASFLPGGASVHVKIQCLPVLDNLVRSAKRALSLPS